MNLFAALNFFWLIPLAGGIIALWMLRLKRQDHTISSLYLWRTLLRENQANSPFQRLRRHLLLLLQLLAALFLIFALAKPFVYAHTLTGRTFVILIDDSASMEATDIRPSRLDEAKAEANKFVDQEMNDTDVATVISVSNKPLARVPFTSDHGRLKQAINDVPPTDTTADIISALTLGQSMVGAGTGCNFRIFTDGAYGPDVDRRFDQFPFAAAGVKIYPIGMPEPDNLGITAMDARRDPDSGQYQIFINVQQTGHGRHTGATLSLYRDGKIIDARPVAIVNGNQSETFSGKALLGGGTFTAKLEGVTDDLESDNSASLVLPPPRKRKVLLVTDGNLFLENGLNLDSDVALSEVAPTDFTTLGKSGAGYSMVVFDGALPAKPLGPGNYLTVDAGGAQTALQAPTGDLASPDLIDQNRTHPVMRFVDLTGINLAKSSVQKAAPWAETLAETDAGPMIAAGEHAGSRVISTSFALSDSDWPLRISFPIFLTNAVDWLTAGSALGPSSPDTPAGGAASITVPAGLTSVTVTKPGGNTALVATPDDGGAVVFEDTNNVGLYHFRGPNDYNANLAVNLLSPTESNLIPELHPGVDRAGATISSQAHGHLQRVRRDLWPIAAAVALLFLTFEWLIYHRRL